MITWRFLNPVEAYDLLSQKDDYLSKVNDFNLELHEVKSLEEYLEKLPGTLYDWHEEQIINCMPVLSEINGEISRLGLDINEEICLILTNGEEMFNLEYTRLNAIVFPYAKIKGTIFDENKKTDLSGFRKPLVAHELFHILSRLRPEIRTPLYSTFGFQEEERDFLPTPYADQVINPDALDHKWTIDLFEKKTKKQIKGFPLIRKGDWRAFLEVNEDGSLSENSVNKTNLAKKIDPSLTGYLSHPEEIAAEYFKISLCYPEKGSHPRISAFIEVLKRLYPEKA